MGEWWTISSFPMVHCDGSEWFWRTQIVRPIEVRVLLLDTAFGREGLSALGVGQFFSLGFVLLPREDGPVGEDW